ncbi:flagellar brake protein [Massilia sp. LXY-6]|uniref:flagellar brake protein n=1 Tax=Massilia sp. LXY-6 TaxID=3379823 RepID=UPI003EE04C26
MSTNNLRKGPPKLSDAVARIAPNTASHEMSDAFQIVDTLSALAQDGEPITVYPMGQDFAMARIDAVDPDKRSFILDLAEDLILAEGTLILVAALGGNAKIQFELGSNGSLLPGRARAVELPLPETCLVLNRRAEARLESPLSGSYGARFVLLGKEFELPLYDFSLGGVGLRATPEQAYEFYVGKKIEGVELELGPSLTVIADLEVRLLRPFRTFLLGQQVQVGCRISNISMQMKQRLDRALSKVQLTR